MKCWESAEQAFDALNDNVIYLVIRNHEEFYYSLFSEEHADIDILCSKKHKKSVISILDAKPRLKDDDGIHYVFNVTGVSVPLDIRYIGDGYYDRKWENDMLVHRVMDKRGFYKMDNDNYFWSLLYHALYHKGKISDEYLNRLEEIKPCNISSNNVISETALFNYMQNNGYQYTIAKDKYLWYHFTDICKGNIKAYPMYYIKKLTRKFKRLFDIKSGE